MKCHAYSFQKSSLRAIYVILKGFQVSGEKEIVEEEEKKGKDAKTETGKTGVCFNSL